MLKIRNKNIFYYINITLDGKINFYLNQNVINKVGDDPRQSGCLNYQYHYITVHYSTVLIVVGMVCVL